MLFQFSGKRGFIYDFVYPWPATLLVFVDTTNFGTFSPRGGESQNVCVSMVDLLGWKVTGISGVYLKSPIKRCFLLRISEIKAYQKRLSFPLWIILISSWFQSWNSIIFILTAVTIGRFELLYWGRLDFHIRWAKVMYFL